jgi:hypothetical protein
MMKTIKIIIDFMCILTVMAVNVQAQWFDRDLLGGGGVHAINCDTGVSEGPSGANVTWTIALIPHDTLQSTGQVVSATGTPYAAKFPSATDALFSQGSRNMYTYFRLTTDSLLLLGFADSLQTVAYFDPQLEALRSLTLGASFTDALGYRDTISVSGVMFVSKIDGTRTVTFDGTGTLVLPMKTFPNAMRFKSVTSQTDSTWFGAMLSSVSRTTTTAFSWQDTTLPDNTSFSITRTMTASTITSVTSTSVTYTEPIGTAVLRTIGHGAENAAGSMVVSQFDNTFAIKVPLTARNGRVVFTVFNASGRTVALTTLHTSSTGVASAQLTSRLTKGVYLYSLKAADGVFGQGKIMVR